MKPSEIIISAETQFAREVALGVIYQLPLPFWYSLIPGMFLFDFIRRNRTIGNFTKFYMLPRKLAVSAATSVLHGREKSLTSEQIEQEIGCWLKDQNLSCQGLHNAYKEFVGELGKHYKKCLSTKKTSYNDMIEDVYKTQEAFETHIDKLEKLETKIDQILMDHTNLGNKFKQRLNIEAQQVKLRRNRMVDDIF